MAFTSGQEIVPAPTSLAVFFGAPLIVILVACGGSTPPADTSPEPSTMPPESSSPAPMPSSAPPVASAPPAPLPSSSADSPPKDDTDKLVLNDSGSTNSPGRTVTVHADGKVHIASKTNSDCTVNEALVKHVLSDLSAAGPIDKITFGKCAAKSASFGQTTTLDYHGQSADIGLDCGPPKEAKAKPLMTDIKALLLEVNKACH